MCFSVTTGSPGSRRGSRPGHIKHSGCEVGRACSGAEHQLPLWTRYELRVLHSQPMPIKSLFVSCGLMNNPDCIWRKGDLTESEEGAAPPKGTHVPWQNYCSQKEQLHGGTWGSVERTKQHPPRSHTPFANAFLCGFHNH